MGDRQTLATQLIYAAKVQALRARRFVADLRSPVQQWPQTSPSWSGNRIEVHSKLYCDDREEERTYELGKVANLRAAIRYIHSIEIPSGEMFSFWRQVGVASRSRGYVQGRMLQLGCVVPAIGGGLCQLSNVLYELALRSGCEIIERHPHSIRLPGGPARDATVAWNYIDLRFRPKTRIRIELKLTSSELIATFVCKDQSSPLKRFDLATFKEYLTDTQGKLQTQVPTCATCERQDCSRHETSKIPLAGVRAFLLDAYWPEFDRYVQNERREDDWLFVPIDGRLWGQVQYGWSTQGFRHVRTQPIQTLQRSLNLRRLSSQGAPRQIELLRTNALMASSMAARLPSSASHIVVDQTMLPALWLSGELGGRTFDVIMTSLPMRTVQNRLDNVANRWPQSKTAADFRAEDAVLDAEEEALGEASRIVTPHGEIAGLFANKSVLLDWAIPDEATLCRQTDGAIPRVLFPGPLTARKGAYELREALQEVNVEVIWSGSEFEGPNFWGKIKNRLRSDSRTDFAAVVQPAFLEARPRTLLNAIASGIPVITTKASGLSENRLVKIVDSGDVYALRQAIISELAHRDSVQDGPVTFQETSVG